MKKLFLTLISALAIFTAVPLQACDNDPGCTCNPLYVVTDTYITEYLGRYLYAVQARRYGDNGYHMVDQSPSDIMGYSLGVADITIYVSESQSFSYHSYLKATGTVTLDCGSEKCTHPTQTTYEWNDRYGDSGPFKCEFVKVGTGIYELVKVTSGSTTVLERDAAYGSSTNDVTLSGNYLSTNSPLRFASYYQTQTTQARLEYRIVDDRNETYHPIITVDNPQYYNEKSYIFGRTPLASLQIQDEGGNIPSHVNIEVRAYFTNGINEYYTPSFSFIFNQEKKGLK